VEIILGSILSFLKVHYGDVSISILTVAVLTFYYKRVKPFLNSIPDATSFQENKNHMDIKTKEIIDNILSIKELLKELRIDISEIEQDAKSSEKNFHNKIDNLVRDLNQISSKVETMMFLSVKGGIK